MLMFWIAASLMIAVALTMVLPALLSGWRDSDGGRDLVNVAIFQEQLDALERERASGAIGEDGYEASRLAIERQMLSDLDNDRDTDGTREDRPVRRGSKAGIAIAVTLPLAALGMYFHFGDPASLMSPPSAETTPAAGPLSSEAAKQIPHSVQEMVASLEARLGSQPEDPDGWLMLGRSYAAMNRLPEARDALSEAYRQRPRHPMTMVALAEVQAGLQGNRLDGTPLELVERALSIDPNFARALWLAGVAAYKDGDAERAVDYWQRLSQLRELDQRSRAQVEQAMAQVGRETARRHDALEGAAGASVAARVELAPELMEKTSPADVVFVFARAVSGPRMPLAVQRLRVADLPRNIVLDDSMAMSPQMRLSAFDEVVLAARVSRTGSATPSPGDLVGASGPVTVGSKETTTVRIAGVSE